MVPRFWRKIRYRYDLTGSHCENCGQYFYPPRNLCPVCRRKGKVSEVKLGEEGVVVSYTVVHNGDLKRPYVVALIELDCGARLISQLTCEAEEARVGMRVKRVFRKYGEDGEEGIIYYGTKFAPVD